MKYIRQIFVYDPTTEVPDDYQLKENERFVDKPEPATEVNVGTTVEGKNEILDEARKDGVGEEL